MKVCPKCKSISKRRMIRRNIMRLIPGTKSYSCDKCNTMYTWFSIVNLSFNLMLRDMNSLSL